MTSSKRIVNYIGGFFSDLSKTDFDDSASYLKISLDEFLEQENKEKAMSVFASFFDCFRIHLKERSFVDLLDALSAYEEYSSVLLEKQRDHLVHSVNVFALGLSIYARNNLFREAFQAARVYPYDGAKRTPAAEFLYRWGLAALLHDIGYPVEIIHNQFKAFISFITEVDGVKASGPFLGYQRFSCIETIDEIIYQTVFGKNFKDALKPAVNVSPLNSTELLSWSLHNTLGVDFASVKTAVTGFLAYMQKSGFVDHGFFSALILLKWYGCLIQRGGLPPDLFYHPVLDSAGAIFLHNFYRNTLMRPPFNLGALSAKSHPIGYLLILCDELQEWNRKAYGSRDKRMILAETSDMEIGEDSLSIHYLTTTGVMAENFGSDKANLIQSVLDVPAILPKGLAITQTTGSELFMADIIQKDKLVARPLLPRLEAMAKIIHENYNLKRQADGEPVEHPSWESLPDTLKYSNIRQARDVYKKLASCGYVVTEEPMADGVEVREFTPEQIEALARDEHDDWVAERLSNGWTHGERDPANKRSPYLVPYTVLPENIKDYDRDAVRNIFPMLRQLGLMVYKDS